MTSLILSITGLVLLAALIVSVARGVGVVSRNMALIQHPAETSPVASYDDSKVWMAIERLNSAVAEGIDHVDRKSKRIDGVIASARKRFEAEGYVDPGLEAEATSLPLDDATGGGNERMSAVPDDVEAYPVEGIPGSVPASFWRDLSGN